MKILNLYAGIGGNRKNWGDEHQITAIEHKQEIADIYKGFFPKDIVIVDDAHKYLLEHFMEFDFIWSSPPCSSHSKVRFIAIYDKNGEIRQKPVFPDMKLWQEIIFLKHHFKGKWIVENVIGYYKPLITPIILGKHYFWSNFSITPIENFYRGHKATIEQLQKIKGFKLNNNIKQKRLLLRNCVEPEIGKHILNCSMQKMSLF